MITKKDAKFPRGCQMVIHDKQCGEKSVSLFKWKTQNVRKEEAYICQKDRKSMINSLMFIGWDWKEEKLDKKEEVQFT